jgi:hypothetical protein
MMTIKEQEKKKKKRFPMAIKKTRKSILEKRNIDTELGKVEVYKNEAIMRLRQMTF